MIKYYSDMNEIYAELFPPNPPPARYCIAEYHNWFNPAASSRIASVAYSGRASLGGPDKRTKDSAQLRRSRLQDLPMRSTGKWIPSAVDIGARNGCQLLLESAATCLFPSQFRVVTHDHRGTGQSSRCYTKYYVEQMTSDVIGLMDRLGIERAHVVGHSTGGAIAQVLAIEPLSVLTAWCLMLLGQKADGLFSAMLRGKAESVARVGSPSLYPWCGSIPLPKLVDQKSGAR